ncbi:MAG: hypothetical protein A2X18_11730 [Bacteroidetes bacterium GWF2_40_14]|nr:MAG: hypothetical protein A2X18_11730 [Bacteroidetes bacterium GWF2_40_14]
MKNYILILSISIFSCFWLNSCLVDEGTYDYKNSNEFFVDTIGKQVKFTVKQFSNLVVNSNLVYSEDKKDLTFKWSLYLPSTYILGASKYPAAISHGFDRDDFRNYEISVNENLSQPITAIPGSYILQFEATNTKTGLTTMMKYTVVVEGTVPKGLVVIYKGVSSIDIDVINTPILNSEVVETFHEKNLYTRGNSIPFNGNPRSCLYVSTGNFIYVASDIDAKRLSRVDMVVANEFNEIFYETPANKDFYMLRSNFIINDGKFYKMFASGSPFFMGPVDMKDNDTYYAAPFALFTSGGHALTYDQNKMRFLYTGMYDGFSQQVAALGTHFLFKNVGKKMIYGSVGYDSGLASVAYCIFKNPIDDGKRYLYVFRTATSHSAYQTQGAFNLAMAPLVESAEFWAFGERGPVVFYSTKNKIYKLNYTLSNGVTGADETLSFAGSEEITFMKLFKYNGISLPVVAKDKYLMVGTYNSSTKIGKLYIYESDISNGQVSKTPVASYTISGKIADVDFIDS